MKSYDVNTIKRVCEKYAFDRFSTRQSIVEDEEFMYKKLNPNKVTKYLHLGISLNIVDDETAEAIKQKAINNSARYSGSTYKIKETYRLLFIERNKVKQQQKQEKEQKEITEKKQTCYETQDSRELYREFFNSTYADVYGDSDEFPQELLDELLYEDEN